MRKIFGIARYTFIEIFRNKVYYVLLLFSAVLIVSTLLLGALGGEQRNRMIIDLGLVSIEAFALLIAVFAAVTLVLVEMESRTLYLILTRPVARYQFVVGRFLGLLLLLAGTILIMSSGHLILLWSQHVHPDRHYFLSLLYSSEKIMVITALAMAFSLFATSTPSAVTFTFFFWIIGHFSSEIRFLAQKTTQPVLVFFCNVFYYIAPNFEVMNLRDMGSASQAGSHWLGLAGGYGLAYTCTCLVIVSLLFRKKEF